MSGLRIENSPDGVAITVKVIPGSSRTMVAGTIDGMLKVKLSTAPEKGKANKSLVDLLAKTMNVRVGSVIITSGWRSHTKRIEIRGADDHLVRSVFDCE